MKISREEVEHIASLARLNFKAEEKEKLISQLDRILKYFEKLNPLDTREIPTTSHVLSLSDVFREDIIKESFSSEVSLNNAPDKERNCFKVPKIIE